MPNTSWNQVTTQATNYANVSLFLYDDASGTYDGEELPITNGDKYYDGVGPLVVPTSFSSVTINSTVWGGVDEDGSAGAFLLQNGGDLLLQNEVDKLILQ